MQFPQVNYKSKYNPSLKDCCFNTSMHTWKENTRSKKQEKQWMAEMEIKEQDPEIYNYVQHV